MTNSRLLAAAARTMLVLAVAAAAVTASPANLQAQEAIAVIVNTANPLSDISLRDLERLYMGDATKFPGGGSATTYEEASVREAFYKAAVDMSVGEVQRHWIQATFSGGGAVAPEEMASPAAALAAVAGSPGAIAVIPASAVDGSVKVITVGGAAPSDAGYPLR